MKDKAMNALGRHMLLELYGCDEQVINNLGLLKDILLEAASNCGATVLSDFFHRFSPHGLSGVVTIAESHLFIHTWPEHGFAAVDIFTCGNKVQPQKAIQVIIEKLKPKNHSAIEIQRGILDLGD